MVKFGLLVSSLSLTLLIRPAAEAGADGDWKEHAFPKYGVKFSLPKPPQVTEKPGSLGIIGEMSDCIALVVVNDHPAGKLKDHEDEEFDRLVTALGKDYTIAKDRKVKADDKHLGRSLVLENEKNEKLLRLFVVGDRVLIIQVTGLKGFLKKSQDVRKFVKHFDLLE